MTFTESVSFCSTRGVTVTAALCNGYGHWHEWSFLIYTLQVGCTGWRLVVYNIGFRVTGWNIIHYLGCVTQPHSQGGGSCNLGKVLYPRTLENIIWLDSTFSQEICKHVCLHWLWLEWHSCYRDSFWVPNRTAIYRDEINFLQIQLSRIQAGPGRR